MYLARISLPTGVAALGQQERNVRWTLAGGSVFFRATMCICVANKKNKYQLSLIDPRDGIVL